MTKIEKEMKDFLKAFENEEDKPNIMHFVGWISRAYPQLSDDLEKLVDNYIKRYFTHDWHLQ